MFIGNDVGYELLKLVAGEYGVCLFIVMCMRVQNRCVVIKKKRKKNKNGKNHKHNKNDKIKIKKRKKKRFLNHKK